MLYRKKYRRSKCVVQHCRCNKNSILQTIYTRKMRSIFFRLTPVLVVGNCNRSGWEHSRHHTGTNFTFKRTIKVTFYGWNAASALSAKNYEPTQNEFHERAESVSKTQSSSSPPDGCWSFWRFGKGARFVAFPVPSFAVMYSQENFEDH